MLVLTDHSNHSSENSLYPLVKSMRLHPYCLQVDVATRGEPLNDFFFKRLNPNNIFVNKVEEDFAFSTNGDSFKKNLRRAFLKEYEVIWLRMPPPLSSDFLEFLIQACPNRLFINNPAGIYETGSKAFLLTFKDCCPPMSICTTIEAIMDFKNQFPIVLKPFREYGGKGIIRIDGDTVWDSRGQMTFREFSKIYKEKNTPYLCVKFLKNVSQGDKRIIVVDGQIMGASLRLPAKDSWLCNVAQGGSAHMTKVSEEEVAIIQKINPVLAKMGIVMYGVDTLVGDDGKRVLSEINTTSIGGLPQIAQMEGKPLVEEATNLMWDYIIKKIREKNVITN